MLKKFTILSFIISSLFVYSNEAESVSYYTDVIPATTRVKFKFSLNNTATRINLSVPHNNNYRGQNTYVVVIDTGVQADHPFLQNRVALEACFAAKCPNGQASMVGPGAAKPIHWHGTHVAGIIAGYNSSMQGVAPQANIIAINVFDPDGASYDDYIIRALNWVHTISSEYNIAAVNMSLGSQMVFKSSCNGFIPDMTKAISNLKSKNISTIVSAGNGYSYGMSSPACISDAVSVAATSYFADEVTNFSNVSELTTFSAPGYVVSSSATGSTYRTASGTSMSAPTVAGAFAVYRSKYGVQPVNKVVSDFQSTSVKAIDKSININTYRIDMKTLFSDDQATTTTTSTTTTSTTTTTTTTIPSTTSTSTTVQSTTTTVPVTTTTIDEDDEDNDDVLNTPYIVSIKRHNASFVYLTFVYRHNSIYVDKYNLFCLYKDRSFRIKTLYKQPSEFNKFYVKLPTANIQKCRLSAISSDNVNGSYSKYVRVR